MRDIQLDVFPDRVFLRFDHQDGRLGRFYLLKVQPDLFSGASLIREWGWIGTESQMRMEKYRDEGQAVDALYSVVRSKCNLGYCVRFDHQWG